jgi:hypothetical protein
MSIFDVILANPDAATAAVTAVLGFFGGSRWRKNAREAPLAEVDRWASSAAGAIETAIALGVFADHDEAVIAYLKRFKTLAAAAGVVIKPEHEARALLIAQESITKAGQLAVEAQAVRLHAAAEALVANLARLLPPDKPTK